MGGKKRNYKPETYPKYNISRSKKYGRDHKICGSDKKYLNYQQSCHIGKTSTTTKPEVVAQLVNEMRALIQEIKTVIGAVAEKLSKKDPNTRETNKTNQGEPKGPHF